MTSPSPIMERKPRPGVVTLAVLLQLLLAAAMAVSAVVGFLYGADANEALDAEFTAQGFYPTDLPAGSVRSGSDGAPLVVPIVVVVLLVVLALLNGGGNRVGRILTWGFQPLVLICGGFVFAGQLMRWSFDNSGDETLEGLDVQQLVEASYNAYPGWSVIVDWAVILLATLGSLPVIILLAVPAANDFFRKQEPSTYIPGAPAQYHRDR